MRVLIGDDWRDGYLDEHRDAEDVRIRVQALAALGRLDDLYFRREASLRTLWNYVREVGPRWVLRKVVSRRREASRNQKFVLAGVGVVEASGNGGPVRPGDAVVFLAPCNPKAFERVVLPASLVRRAPAGLEPARAPGAILWTDAVSDGAGPVEAFGGFAVESGNALDPAALEGAFAGIIEILASRDWPRARRLPAAAPSPVEERAGSLDGARRPSAVLFGYGNYGRTMILNNVRRSLGVAAIHEIDPTLLPPGRDAGVRWDTCPGPRDDERYDVFLIATYHHTHAGLAVRALRQGAVAVVEKPLATTRPQLRELLDTLEATRGRFFAGFHKRYSPFNALARRDLGTAPGEPVNYHAIVFEEPLPARHWYRWPNSRSRLVSNGCHWLDHFLFLNDWAEPASFEVFHGGRGDGALNVSVTLANGAFFSMLLTDEGSGRTGVRDYVELRARGVTVTIENGGRYTSENRQRILRRERMNKLVTYETMYRTISARIAGGEAGDSPESVRISTTLVLDVEEAASVP